MFESYVLLKELNSLSLLWDPPHLSHPSQSVTAHHDNTNEAPYNNERLKRVCPQHGP